MWTVRYDVQSDYAVYWQPVPKRLPIRFGHVIGYIWHEEDSVPRSFIVKAIDGEYTIPAEELNAVEDNR